MTTQDGFEVYRNASVSITQIACWWYLVCVRLCANYLRKRGYVLASVWWSVCQLEYSKSFSVNFCEILESGRPWTNLLETSSSAVAERPHDTCSSTINLWLSKSAFLEEGWITLSANFRWKGASPTNHCWSQKTRVIALLCGIKISAVHCLVLSQSMHMTDRQMDRQNYNYQDHASVAASHSKNLFGVFCSVIFVNENENENGEKRENNEFVNAN